MRQKTAEQWAEHMGLDKGLIVIAAMPEGGLTTLTDVSLMETDRLLRDFVSIEEAHHRERELENIDVTTYDTTKGRNRGVGDSGFDSQVSERLRDARL